MLPARVAGISQLKSNSEASDLSMYFKDSVPVSHSPPANFSIGSTFTHEQAELAASTIQEVPPSSNSGYEEKAQAPDKDFVYEARAQRESKFLNEMNQSNDELGKSRFSKIKKSYPSEIESDPLDDTAIVVSVMNQDAEERAVTFRSILIGLMTSALGACIAEVFIFKPVHVRVDLLFLQMVCLCLGHTFGSIPGPAWWNPGPIATKELAFSLIMAASASAGVFGAELIATQEVIFDKKISIIVTIMTVLSSQLIGYGMAGILRPVLVYPSNIIFPAVLPAVALFHSMSTQSETSKNQISFFKKTIGVISFYEIFPTYIAPALSAISIWCLALPKVPAITNLFGGSLPGEGMGLMTFSADWTLVGSHSPLYVPLIAQITTWIAYFGCIVIFSWGYTANLFGGSKLPFMSFGLLDSSGKQYNITAAMHKNGTANAMVIEQIGLPYLSSALVFYKAFFCMSASASITIGVFSSVVSVLKNRKDKKIHGKISKPCPHREATKNLRDFPTYDFAAIFLGAITLAFLSAHFADSGLSPLALLVALIFASSLSLAAGYFNGTLGIDLRSISIVQVTGGLLFPGNAIGNMWFTLYGHNTVQQCVLMLRDLKLGIYMHLSPISIVIGQLIGTIFGSLVHVVVMNLIIRSQRDVLLMPHGNGVFSGMSITRMATSSTSMGLFSRELYYPGKIYAIVPYLLIAGFFAPVPFLIIQWYHPKSILSQFNVSLFIAHLSHGAEGANAGQFTSVFVGFMSQFYMRRYRFRWYKKYNYILCAALDGGTQMTVVLLAFLFQGGAGFQVRIPNYFLNPQGPRDYCKMSED